MSMPGDLHLLILEDYSSDTRLKVNVLEEQGFACTWELIQTREAFLTSLESPDYDIILADYNLPDFDGSAVLNLYRKHNLKIPLIMISDSLGEETAVEVLKAGAVDFVLKDGLKRLGPAVERALRDSEAETSALGLARILRFSIDNAPEAVYWLTKDGGFSDVNAQACRMLGYTREELLDLSLYDIDPDYPAERWHSEWLRSEKANHDDQKLETLHRRKDGTLIPVEVLSTHKRFEGDELHVAFVREIADRKQAEEALQRSEKQYRAVVDQAADALFLHDIQGQILDVNRRACESLGYTRKELLAMNVYDLDIEASKDDKNQTWEGLKTDQPTTIEGTHQRRDGSTFPVEVSLGLLDIDNHNLILAMVRETSERKRVEEALRLSEDRLQQALRVSQIGIFEHDHRSNEIYWSPEQRVIYGWGPDEEPTIPKFVEQAFPQEDCARVAEAAQRAHDPNGEGLFDIENQITRRDGEIRWLTTRSKTFFEGKGVNKRPARTVGAVVDITERKEIEAALRRTQFTVDQARDPIFWVGANAELLYVNEAACDSLDYTREELLSMTVFDIDPALPPEAWPGIWKSAREGHNQVLETMHQTKGGRAFAIEIANSFMDFEGLEYNCAFARDISERKQAEQERETLIAELEARNADLAQKNAELERFTYTVSHDLKNPLVTIKGFTGMLQRDIGKADIQRLRSDLEMVSKAADHMNRMLDELLELSRIGRVVNTVDRVSLAKLVEEVLMITKSQLDGHAVKVTVRNSLADVRGDPIRLMEVFQNLIGNAMKFKIRESAAQIEIGADVKDDAVLCWVRDNGVGIDPEYHDRIFGLFERLDQTRDGTGIGLALVKRIVEFHEGRIWVESEGKGQGSTFYFTLPKAR